MKTSIASAKGIQVERPETLRLGRQPEGAARSAMLVCGILASLLYVGMNIIVPRYFPGYDAASQTVSELSAIDAPSRPLWVVLATLFSLLVVAFGLGIWMSARTGRRLRMVSILMLVFGLSGFFWPPMHQREVLAAGGGTLTDTMHIIFAMATVVLMMMIMGFGAAALGVRFRIYSVISLIAFIVFGILIGQDGPDLSRDLPTPLLGVWERVNIGVFMLWMIVLSFVLLRKRAVQR